MIFTGSTILDFVIKLIRICFWFTINLVRPSIQAEFKNIVQNSK